MDLSIIIVNWNSKHYLQECVKSLLTEIKEIEFEVIVIDAGSFDGSETITKNKNPRVHFIQSPENVGFARSNNRAFESSSGDCILFINPDTEPVASAINTLYRSFQLLPRAGVVGCRLLNSDGTLQTSSIQAFPTLLNQFIEADPLLRIFPRARLWGKHALFNNSETPIEVDVVSGACMMIQRTVFETVGRFSADYFTYSEDVDLCFKAKLHGFKNYYVPSAAVIHHGGISSATSSTSFASVMHLESRWRFFAKTKSKLYAQSYRVGIGIISTARLIVALALWTLCATHPRSKAKWRAVLGKWWHRLRWTLGAERWVENY